MEIQAAQDAAPPEAADHRAELAKLRRIEGQVRGVVAMIDSGRYCIDILTQLQAARAAIAGVERDILERHIGGCVAAAMASGNAADRRAKTDELAQLLKRALR